MRSAIFSKVGSMAASSCGLGFVSVLKTDSRESLLNHLPLKKLPYSHQYFDPLRAFNIADFNPDRKILCILDFLHLLCISSRIGRAFLLL
jgi:hypothetical protein